MKGLGQFRHFDWDAFSSGKVFVVTGVSPWKEYQTDKPLGTRVEVVIYRDDTPYRSKDGEKISNLFEKLNFKVAKDVSCPIGAKVVPVKVSATVYGDYQNQLSVKADDIQVVQSQTASKP